MAELAHNAERDFWRPPVVPSPTVVEPNVKSGWSRSATAVKQSSLRVRGFVMCAAQRGPSKVGRPTGSRTG